LNETDGTDENTLLDLKYDCGERPGPPAFVVVVSAGREDEDSPARSTDGALALVQLKASIGDDGGLDFTFSFTGCHVYAEIHS
jgi:hypothetical protein